MIEMHCPRCRGGSVAYSVRLLLQRRGDMTFENLLRRLRCKRCQAVKPAPVYLVAGHHRTARGGPDADWSIELTPPPETDSQSSTRPCENGLGQPGDERS